MTNRYKLEDRPVFNQGEEVEVDFECFGCDNVGVKKGKIVGKSYDYIVTGWLVDFGETLNYPPMNYPYTTLTVQHPFILKK